MLKPLTTLVLAVTFVLAGDVRAAYNQRTSSQLDQLSLPQLEQKLAQIDEQLRSLSPYSLRSGIGVIGYRSDWRETSGRQEWVDIQLDRECPIDEIVLVPTLSRDTLNDYRSDGFPKALRILAGTDEDRKGVVVAEYNESDNIQPRRGPLKVQLNESDNGIMGPHRGDSFVHASV